MSGKGLNNWRLCWSEEIEESEEVWKYGSVGVWYDFLNSNVMTPLSYQGFGFTAILVMVGILSVAQLLKYLKEKLKA